ncbi:hypothetical protein ACFSR7_16785 [Cohnella sp. GCM10020058]|uniref:hypothetical protein n=1 Tax=Cohnella sp. GCM10020058 TaxID=3317330 RepID=UPI0036355DE0
MRIRAIQVMHAVSSDLLHWEKLPEDKFYAPAEKYEPDDWRDPFVFWNEDAGQYWMLLAARAKEGPAMRKGCTALCVSTDLQHWEVADPLWAPESHYAHECPDLFRIGGLVVFDLLRVHGPLPDAVPQG